MLTTATWTSGAILAIIVGWWYLRERRLHDPLDVASYAVQHEPRLDVARFDGLRSYDPLNYDDGIAAIREFSREYQESFLNEPDHPVGNVLAMARCRRRMHKHMHALRMWLPNDSAMERRLLAGIEETDAGMAWAMAELTRRYPGTKLMQGAGILMHPTVRGYDDVWED